MIFTLTPYNSDTYYLRARYFAQHGYVYALVDVRGRGNSEGSFLPFENEGHDGRDVVEWLAAQPWSNGKVAMWGGSYDFDKFPFFSRLVAKGSRLRLFLRCPNTIHLQKNYNSGGVVADETARDARVAHVTVYHAAKHPSALTLPVVQRD